MATQKNDNFQLAAELYGEDVRQIDFDTFEKPVHSQMVADLSALKKRASEAGFALCLASAYRSFEQQLLIWNEKASGKRLVLDAHERAIDITKLDSNALVHAILRWSALPGASRHHWGCDFDVYDKSSVCADERLELTCAETEVGGKFEKFYCWLEKELEFQRELFFRPYAQDLGGVSPEPWHISYRPVAQRYQQEHSLEGLRLKIEDSPILLKDEILGNLEEIYTRYFLRVAD